METRTAIVRPSTADPDPADLLDRVRAYLPGNYTARLVVEISGVDRAGWTMTDYVLPRLASGLMFGREVNEVPPWEQ